MSDPLKQPPDSPLESFPQLQFLGFEAADDIRHFNRTPRPYHHDGLEVHQDSRGSDHERGTSRVALVPEQGRDQRPPVNDGYSGPSGQASVAGSESGTEADDERPTFVKALPAPFLRPRKGLKTGEKNEDALLTPSQLDDEGRRLSLDYFRRRPHDTRASDEEAEAEQEKLLRRRVAEFVRRSSEVALVGAIVTCVLCGKGVWQTACQWWRELLSHVVIITVLILAYPVKLSIVDTGVTDPKLWQRFRVPASFDPATILYPPLFPVLVALTVSPSNAAVVLPNIILGLASLPQRLFPRSSRLGGFNVVHWFVSIIPLIVSSWLREDSAASLDTYKTENLAGLSVETLVSLYPLHHALLQPLHYLTTTSLLMSELHLLSAVLINLLLRAQSPQTVILKACLWIGGIALFVTCGPLLHWNVTLARLPRWKLRRSDHSSKERRSLVDAVSELINLQRAMSAFRGSSTDVDSDADEDMPKESITYKANGMPKLRTTLTLPGLKYERQAPVSAVEPHYLASNGYTSGPQWERPRSRRYTLPEHEAPVLPSRSSSNRRTGRTRLRWYLQLTLAQVERRKRLYATYFYLVVAAIVLVPIRQYIADKALHGREPFGWAIGYLLGQIPLVRFAVDALDLHEWASLPPQLENWPTSYIAFPLDVSDIRDTLGLANVRLLLILYWAAVLLVGLLAVFSLTAFVEVDTRRKIFHGVMVAMLVPSMFVDPCYCALTLALVLVVFLLLEVIRAGQVPPLGNAIGRFIAPYVDGRDLRGPVVVSHIFLLIGCAVPLWFSLASIDRGDDRLPWVGWELASNSREVAMTAGVICVGMGDAAASLIGRRYGRHKWIWVGGKSLEGSAAFSVAVTTGLMATKAWLVFGGWNDTGEDLAAHLGADGNLSFIAAWTITLAKAMLCACGASFMEAVLTGANDNVVVPVALWLLVKGARV